MHIELNGRLVQTAMNTLAALLVEQGMDGGMFATAMDGYFVPRSQREATAIRDGAKVEVLAPMQGG
jgi:sulfur carrier protein